MPLTGLAGLLTTVAALAVAAGAVQQDHQHPAPEKLGNVHFETSCRAEVSAAFDRAVALLHSFAFGTARSAFQDVAKADPACAMAHWGIALTYWGNPFGGLRSAPALASGAAAIERGLATGTPTHREAAWLAAAATLFADHQTVDQRTRVLAYERAMEAVARAHPADMEAQIFHALAVNQTALPTDKTFAQQLRAAAILEPLFARHPDHPGLAHYIIHAYDHPPLASKALDAARRYASIAPSVPHALHMPSHTFTRVGSWQESVDTNLASADTAIRENSFGDALHAMDYQVYAYLQMARDRDARRVVDEAPRVLARLEASTQGAASGSAGLYATAAIPARYAMERGDWAEAAALPTRTTATAYSDAVTHFARAVGAARSRQPAAAEPDLVRLDALHAHLVTIGDTYWAEQVRIQRQVSGAWVLFARGQRVDALAELRSAADAEDATDKAAISPGPLAPAREQLGEMLLELRREAEALAAFEAVMQKEPRRFRATFLAGRTAALLGDRAKATRYFRELMDIARTADTERPELAEARAFLGERTISSR